MTVEERLYAAIAADIDAMVQDFKSDPQYWTNNKRKMHGLPVRRKQGKKSRKYYYYQKHKQQLFGLIEEAIDQVLPQKINEAYGQFAEIKEIPYG